MVNTERSYEVLGLQPGASQEAIKQAHKELLDRWYPELLSTKTDMQKEAKQKIREINEASDLLLLSIGPDRRKAINARSDSPAEQPQIRKEEKPEPGAASASVVPLRYLPPAFGLFGVLLFSSLVSISSPGGILLGITSGGLGWALGTFTVRGIESLNSPKQQKVIIAWMSFALFFAVTVSAPSFSGRSNSRSTITRVSPPKKTVGQAPKPEPVSSTQPLDPTAARESSDFLREGRNLIAAGRYEEAVSALTKSVQLNPRDPMPYNNRGMAYAYMKEYKKAIDDYAKSIALKPEESGPYFNRGIVYVAMGDYQHAIEDYKTAAQLGNEEAINFFRSQDIVW